MPDVSLSVKELYALWVMAVMENDTSRPQIPFELLDPLDQDFWMTFARLLRDYTRSSTPQ